MIGLLYNNHFLLFLLAFIYNFFFYIYYNCNDHLPVMHAIHRQCKPNPQVLIHLRLGHTEWNEHQHQATVLKVNY